MKGQRQMRLRFRPLVIAFFLGFSLVSYVLGGLPIFWGLENQEDFLAGEVDGLSVSSDGVISLAPATRNLYEGTDPFFWSLVSDSQGNLYAGSGNGGKVYKIDPQGNGSVLLDTNELEVHGLATDRQGNLYAATSPRGRVYKIAPRGRTGSLLRSRRPIHLGARLRSSRQSTRRHRRSGQPLPSHSIRK